MRKHQKELVDPKAMRLTMLPLIEEAKLFFGILSS